MTHTSLAGIYKIEITLKDMNELLYQAAIGRRLKLLVGNLIRAKEGGLTESVELQLKLLAMLAREEKWL